MQHCCLCLNLVLHSVCGEVQFLLQNCHIGNQINPLASISSLGNETDSCKPSM